jgi:class 3 adenylate cyclase
MPTRRSLPLGLRVFLITALLIAVSMGAAIAVTSILLHRIAATAVEEDLTATSMLQESLQKERFDRLQLISRLFARDASMVAYFAEAAQGGDTKSILSLLDERQSDFGFDFAILLDPTGKVVAHTAKPAMVGQDLSSTALVAKAVTDFEASGIWREGDNLFDAVAVPLSKDFTLLGFLVTGFAINDQSAREIQRVSGAEVAFIATGDGRPLVVASTLPRISDGLVRALTAQPTMMTRLAEPAGLSQRVETMSLGGERWAARLSPLLDAKKQPLGAIVALSSIDQELASYRQIQDVLLLAGALSALIAFFPTFWLTRRALDPVKRLADAAEAARQGDYGRATAGSERTDEVGQLARSFDHLLADLREKRDMETYVTELSKNLPEPSGGRTALGLPQSRDVLILGLELRGYSRVRADAGPGETLDRLSGDLKQLAITIAAASGQIETVAGHRVMVRFDGRRRALHALQAAAEILRPFGGEAEEAAEWAAPMLALAAGTVVSGPVSWSEQGAERANVGLPVQQLESLMREGTSGEILLSRAVYDEIKEFLAHVGYQLAPRRGVINPQPFFVLSAAMAARLAGSRSLPSTSLTEAFEAKQTISGISPGAVMGSRFEILAILGSGGMGVVYKARDRELDDLVALKMLRRDLWGDSQQLDRLKSELKLARKITHPNVLRTFDFGEIDGMPYISMEYVRGVTLRYLLDQTERLPYSAGLRLAKQLCAGLAAAHAVGVIHRDIKPENLLLEPTGNAKLMDFGIAKPVERSAPGQTREGFIVGTPQYMAPEQLQGQEADLRADIYSAGVVFYEIFTGELPFTAPTAIEVMLKHLKDEPPPMRTHWAEIPPALEAIVERCLKKTAAERFATVPELLRALEAL